MPSFKHIFIRLIIIYIQFQKHTNALMKKETLLLVFILAYTFTANQNIDDHIPPVRCIKNIEQLNLKVLSSGMIVMEDFLNINYQISYDFYISNGSFSIQELYSKKAYEGSSQLSKYCHVYPTTVVGQDIQELQLEAFPHFYHHSVQEKEIYVITGDGILSWIAYNQNIIKKLRSIPFPENILKFENGATESTVTMVELQRHLYLFIDQMAYIFNNTDEGMNYFQQMHIQTPQKTSGFSGLYQEGSLWVSGLKSIEVYKVEENHKFSLITEISNFTQEQISGVIMEKQKKKKIFYITTINKLHIIVIEENGQQVHEDFSINGTCTQIQKIKNALYLGCTYEKVNYVMELQVLHKNKQSSFDVYLNRFYDDQMLEGIRRVEPLGFDKVLMIGQETTMMIGEAVHRSVLLDLAGRKKQQRSDLDYSFGLVDVINLKTYATSSSSTIIVLKTNSIGIVRVLQVPPQLWCNFNKYKNFPSNFIIDILVVFNTSHCPYSANDPTTIGGSNVVCESYYGFQYKVGVQQYTSTTAKATIFGIALLLLGLTYICLCWCSKFRKEINRSREAIEEKIEKFKKERKEKEMQKI